MDKKQLLADIEAAGLINNFRSDRSEWFRAFEAFNKATGQRREMNCGTCFRDVLAWLRA